MNDQSLAVDFVGGRVTDWKDGEIDVFYPQKTINGKTRGGMHPCFPNFESVDKSFGLPRHGGLRDLGGILSSIDNASFRAEFNSDELLGTTGKQCLVEVNAFRIPNGFIYLLASGIPEVGEFSFPVSAGLHPYFATPRGVASVHVDGVVQKVTEEHHISYIGMTRNFVDVKILGVGVIRMTMIGDFMTYTLARIVVWRDSLEYICVEPVLALPSDFGSALCCKISHGEPVMIGCKFELISKHVEDDLDDPLTL